MKSKRKISKSFLVVIIIIIIVVVLAWLFWPNIQRLIIGDVYEAIVIPSPSSRIDVSLKTQIIDRLETLKKYGEWPIAAVRDNPNRGDPFDLK